MRAFDERYRVNVLEGYGLSETSPVASFNTLDRPKKAGSIGVPIDGVVREGDGSMTIWVTADRRHFTRREVKLGIARNGYWQIAEGVRTGELVATEGALFLSNELAMASQ